MRKVSRRLLPRFYCRRPGHPKHRPHPIMLCQRFMYQPTIHTRNSIPGCSSASHACIRLKMLRTPSVNRLLFTDNSCGKESRETMNALLGRSTSACPFSSSGGSLCQKGIASRTTVHFFHVASEANRISTRTTLSSYSTPFFKSWIRDASGTN